MRDRLEEQLAAQGKLPQGVTLDTPQQYRDATGHGELWVDAAGLPLRLTVHLVYPEARNGSHVEADIKTDFSRLPRARGGRAVVLRAAGRLGRVSGQPGAASGRLDRGRAPARLRWRSCIAALALLAVPRRSRKFYAAVVVTVILLDGRRALLQSERVVAFSEEQAARQAQQEQQAAGPGGGARGACRAGRARVRSASRSAGAAALRGAARRDARAQPERRQHRCSWATRLRRPTAPARTPTTATATG